MLGWWAMALPSTEHIATSINYMTRYIQTDNIKGNDDAKFWLYAEVAYLPNKSKINK